MTGAAPARPDLATMRTLLSAARAMAGPVGLSLELCLTTLALPGEVVAIRLELIDWRDGIVRVPARGGVERILALPNAARQSILRAAGEAASCGQAVTAGRGTPLDGSHLRLDRLLDQLAEAAPNTIRLPEWNFHGIRAEAARLLTADGTLPPAIDAVLGRKRGKDWSRVRGDPSLAAVTAERWNSILFGDRTRSPAAALRAAR